MVRAAKSRRVDEQFKSELEAILRLILVAHPLQGCAILIDNQSVATFGAVPDDTWDFRIPLRQVGDGRLLGELAGRWGPDATGPAEADAFDDAVHLISVCLSRGSENTLDDRDYMSDAIAALADPVAIFDVEDRFVFWNTAFEQIYAGPNCKITVGLRFEDHLRNCLHDGLVVSAKGREEEWLKERLERFHSSSAYHEHKLANGRWVRVQDRQLPNGGRIGLRTDITHLVESQQAFQVLFDANPVPMYLIDRISLRFVAVNDVALQFYGYSREQFLGLRLPDIRPEKTEGEIAEALLRVDDPSFGDVPRYHRTASGELRVVKVGLRIIDYRGVPTLLAAIFDITRQHQVEEELRRARAFLKNMVDQVPTALFAKDMNDGGRYVFYNRAAEEIFERSVDETIGLTSEEIFPADEARFFHDQDMRALRAGPQGLVEESPVAGSAGTRWIRTKKVALSDDPSRPPRYVLGVSEDVTEQKAREAAFAHKADHDHLTGLANRARFLRVVSTELASLNDRNVRIAIHYLDLDGFKRVNDERGHVAGDQLLEMVAQRLREAVRKSDLVARLGGDEFAIMQRISNGEDATRLAARVTAALSHPFIIDNVSVRIGVSVGIAQAPRDGLEARELIDKADQALYRSKRSGRGTFTLWESSIS